MPVLDPNFMWISFTLFALTNAITPGPNVILLASSGSAWGLRKTIPHLIGVSIGFPLMFLAVQYGSDLVFKKFPLIFPILTGLSLLYVLWLSIRIFKMGFGGVLKIGGSSRPMTFIEAVSFQWINGKAWQSALMASTLYATSYDLTRLVVAFVVIGVMLFSGIVWVELGKRITVFLKQPSIRKGYFSFLAIALMLSTWPTGISKLLTMFQ